MCVYVYVYVCVYSVYVYVCTEQQRNSTVNLLAHTIKSVLRIECILKKHGRISTS